MLLTAALTDVTWEGYQGRLIVFILKQCFWRKMRITRIGNYHQFTKMNCISSYLRVRRKVEQIAGAQPGSLARSSIENRLAEFIVLWERHDIMKHHVCRMSHQQF